MILKEIPSTKEKLPVTGMGTWQTFDKPTDADNAHLLEILKLMKEAGATLIDSSPMYGRAEALVGTLTRSGDADSYFYATKVWTTGKAAGIEQMNESMAKLQRHTIDLVQVHNLVDWQTQLETLREWKATGKIRYIGITHYTDEMHDTLVKIISRTEGIDFVQFNYSIAGRHAEKHLLPVAADNGIATLINRPLRVERLFAAVKGKSLPAWSADYGIDSWVQFFLSYIINHPAVTCIIPATSSPAHMADNLKAGSIVLDENVRKKMAAYIDAL